MDLADSYKIEAKKADDTDYDHSDGGLVGAAMVSFVPQRPGLPRHDIVGLKFLRRFGRGFIQVFSGTLKEYVFCVVTNNSRVYVRASDGTCLVTPHDYELYI